MTSLGADLLFISTENGGRRSAVSSGYRPQFYFDGLDYECTVTFPDTEQVQPGDWVLGQIALSKFASDLLYCRVGFGCKFELREGSRVVAEGTVTGVSHDPAPPKSS